MKYSALKNEIAVSAVEDFVPERIFECGQCFRWNAQSDGSYIGVARGRAARVSLREGCSFVISGGEADFLDLWKDYFDLDRDYAAIRRAVSIDGYMAAACDFGRGIRILNQDRWEALCSFIISQCNNIPRIKGIIERLCALWGEPVEFEGRTYFSFPSAGRVAALQEADLAPLRCGYRAEYIINAARAVDSGALDLDELAAMPGAQARCRLKSLRGVGDKVANCALLFGLNQLDSFPVDVWIKRVLDGQYKNGFDPAVFGPYAGIAQQYMFYYARSGPGAEPGATTEV